MNIGDIVLVTNTESLPLTFLGMYGRVTNVNNVHEYKVTVEFYHPIDKLGGISHTAFESDLKKIGEANFYTQSYCNNQREI